MQQEAFKRYGQTARILHWLTAGLILISLVGGLTMVRLEDGPAKDSVFDLHRSFGALILAIVVVRLAWRLTHPAPLLPASIHPVQRFLADVTHWVIYGLIIAQPVIGWLGGSAFDDSMRIFGLFDLPHLIGKDEPLGDILMATHGYVAYAIIAIIALHIAAAAYHIARQDNVMARMWW